MEGRPAHLKHLPIFAGLGHFLLFCERLLGKAVQKPFRYLLNVSFLSQVETNVLHQSFGG